MVDPNGRVETFRSIVGIGVPRTLNLPANERKRFKTLVINKHCSSFFHSRL